MSDNSAGKSNPPTHKGSGYERKNYFSDSLSVQTEWLLDARKSSLLPPICHNGQTEAR